MYVVDEQDDKVYTYNLPDAIIALLSTLTLSDIDFGEFSAREPEYTAIVDASIVTTTVEASAATEDAKIAIAPDDADDDPQNGHQVAVFDGAEIDVTVTSEDGSRTRVYRVVIERANRAPVASELPAFELTVGDEPTRLNLAEFFSDPDDDPLSYTVGASSDARVATVEVADGVVTVTPVGAGTATFAVTASDGELSTEPRTVSVTVKAAAASAEVRIAARPRASGAVEFGLQVRAADGSWGELIQPRLRLLPAGVEVGRWLVSSPMNVGEGDSARSVRIAAQRRADGSVEFALQVQGEDEAWGERLLPPARVLPADADLDRWLFSSPLSTPEP